MTSVLIMKSKISSLWNQGKARLGCLVHLTKASLWNITPCCKMALISPIRGILRVPSHCLSMVLVNITHHAEGYIFLAHIIKEQDTTYLEYAGRVKPLTPIHILVSHHLCHQGGFEDVERYTFYCKSCLLHFTDLYIWALVV